MDSNDIYKNIKTKNRSKTKLAIISLCIIVLIAVLIFLFIKFNEKKISYITQNPIIANISQDVSATGTLSPTDKVEVGSQISGTIDKVFVDVNDTVKNGQILAQINPEKLNQSVDNYLAQIQSANAELYSAEVQLENKKWNYDNYLDLHNQTNGKSPSKLQLKTSELEYKNALANIEIKKATIKQLETSLNSAKIDVKNSIIISPTNGIILSKGIEVGQTVAASFSTPTLFTIAKDLTKMKLISNVLEADIGKVKVGQNIEFSIDAYPNEVFSAKIAKVNFADASSAKPSSSSSSNSSSSSSSTNIISYEVTTYVNNDKLLLRPGMSATATIKTEFAEDALIIPYQTLLFNSNKITKKQDDNSMNNIIGGPPKRERKQYSEIGHKGNIWILENNIPKEIEVDIGISNGKYVQILSNNIDKNTEIIIQTQLK